MFKASLENRENRRAIEDICREALGHKVTLSVTVGAQAAAAPAEEKKESTRARQNAENDPKLRALKEKFCGEIVEVIKPEG